MNRKSSILNVINSGFNVIGCALPVLIPHTSHLIPVMATFHLIIKRKVQGVFYRVSAKKEAIRIGITGWVKNTPERHVEIIASGTEDQLQKFVEWCKNGPTEARVEKVITEEVVDQHFDEFKILR